MRRTLFDMLDVRSAAELSKVLAELGKQAQDTAIRMYKEKETGNPIDPSAGCRKITRNEPAAEALWKKYHYFLAQTEFRCEIAPASDFRDCLKPRAFKQKEGNTGPPVAKPRDSEHVLGDALDQSSRCQDQPSVVSFDFDASGQLILVRVDGGWIWPQTCRT